MKTNRLVMVSCFLLCLATFIMLDVFPLFWAIPLTLAVFAIWRLVGDMTPDSGRGRWRKYLFVALYSLAFGQAASLGRQVVFHHFRASMHENYITINFQCIFAGILISTVVFPFVLYALRFATSHDMLAPRQGRSMKNAFLLSLLTITIFWLPYLLAFAPGGIVGDGAETLEEVLRGGAPTTNHWSVPYILTLRLFVRLGLLISDDFQIGIYMWVIVAAIAQAAVYAYVASFLWRRGAPTWFALSTIAMYALCGFFASYGMSLWKDGLFGAAVVLLSLLLWDFGHGNDDVGKLKIALFAAVCLFLCVWRSNGPFLVAPTLLGMAILLRRRGRPLVVYGMAIVVFSAILTGPIYRACGIGNDSLRESVSVPLQQLAAVINNDRPLTDSQRDVLFDMLPEASWRKYYSPGISDDLKVRLDRSKLSSQFPKMLRVWAQLLPGNFGLYVQAYLMQTIGFWRPFCWQGLFFDYWVGIEDLHNRGYHSDDKILKFLGYDLTHILRNNMRFLSSGTMVWVLLLSLTVILCRRIGRGKRLLPLLPLVAGWAMIMISTPMAYFYRYIVFLPMALPIIIALPFGAENAGKVTNDSCSRLKEMSLWKSTFLPFVFLMASLSALLGAISIKGEKTPKVGDTPFDIMFHGHRYNADKYVLCGIGKPGAHWTWSSGSRMDVKIPVKSSYKDFDIRIYSLSPFNGSKRWIVRQRDTILCEGALDSDGYVEFRASAKRGWLSFSVVFPDAERPCDIDPDNHDNRLLAMRLRQIRIGPHMKGDD